MRKIRISILIIVSYVLLLCSISIENFSVNAASYTVIKNNIKVPEVITEKDGVIYSANSSSGEIGNITIPVPNRKKISSVQLLDSNGKYIKHLFDHTDNTYRIGTVQNKGSVNLTAITTSPYGYFEWWQTSGNKAVWAFDLDGVRHFRKFTSETSFPISTGTYQNTRKTESPSTNGYSTTGNKPSWYNPSTPNHNLVFADETPNKTNVGWNSRNIAVTNTTFTGSGLSVPINKLKTVNATVKYENNNLIEGFVPTSNILQTIIMNSSNDIISNKRVELWFSARMGNFGISTVSENGLLMNRFYNQWTVTLSTTLYKYDTYQVVAYYEDIITNEAELIVEGDLNGCLNLGSSVQLNSTILKPNGYTWNFSTSSPHEKLEYKSSNNSVATISNTGLVKLVGEGTATITITYTEGDGSPAIVVSKSVTAKTDCTTQPTPTQPPEPTEPTEPPKEEWEVTPGSCSSPITQPQSYEYEIDLIVNRIDARTVQKNTETNTDVYVKRENFSSNRKSAKDEFTKYISQVQDLNSKCNSLISTWQSEKAKAESESDAEKVSQINNFIASAEKMLTVYREKINLANSEIASINTAESKYSTLTPTVFLYSGNTLVSSVPVTLTEGQQLRITMPKWTVKEKNTIYAQINTNGTNQEFAYINLSSRLKESRGYNTSLGHKLYPSTVSNNWKDTLQYVVTEEELSCPLYSSNEFFKEQVKKAVVRTVNDNGVKREIFEQVTTKFVKLPRTKMKSGYGFQYQIQTIYENFDTEQDPSNATGTKEIKSYFPTIVKHQNYVQTELGYEVPMQSADPSLTRNEVKTWLLPPVAVETFSGNVFTVNNGDYNNHPERDYEDQIITTDNEGQILNRWYTNFDDSDGAYNFTVITTGAGLNLLSTCHIGTVLIEGVPLGDPNGNDSFIKRKVTTENPFPNSQSNGIGWNWQNNTDLITDLDTWYNNSSITKPSEILPSQYYRTFYLTPKKIDEINEYIKQHPTIKFSEFVQDHLMIPNSK